MKVEGLLFKLEVQVLLLSLEELLLEHLRLDLLVGEVFLKFQDAPVTGLLDVFALGDWVVRLPNQHLQLVCLVAKLLVLRLQTLLDIFLLLESFAQLCFETNIHRLLQSCIDLL